MFATKLFVRSRPAAALATPVMQLRCSPLLATPSMRMFSFKPSAGLVKQLRDMTGSPLKDCMSVLTETEGDLDASKDLLRKKGLAFAEKRADRDATEGLIGIKEDSENNVLTMVQFSCETDFVAKTDRFRDALSTILTTVHQAESLRVGMEQTRDQSVLDQIVQNMTLTESLDPDQAAQNMEEGIKYTISKTQENCQLQRVYKTEWKPDSGQVLCSYLHNKVLPGVGKIGTTFLLESGDPTLNPQLEEIARSLAMHTAAMKPSYTHIEQLPQKAIDQAIEEAKDLAVQNAKEGMPEQAKQKMLAGVEKKAVAKLQKAEVLMEQELATSEANQTVAKYLHDEGERLGRTITIKEWTLFMIR